MRTAHEFLLWNQLWDGEFGMCAEYDCLSRVLMGSEVVEIVAKLSVDGLLC